MAARVPLNPLRTFVEVATHLSFSKAASALNVTPAAVSSQIRHLEEHLGVALFVRHGRKITLTESGQTLLPGLQSGFSQINESVRLLSIDREKGVLNVSMLASFLEKWLTPRLHEFYEQQPDIDLRINADTTPVDFRSSDFHAAIRFGAGEWKGLKARKLLDDWVVPVCSPELFEKYGAAESLDDLNRYPLLHSADEPWACWHEQAASEAVPTRGPTFNDSISTAAAALRGLGLGLARWSIVAEDLEQGRLVRPIDVAVPSDWAYYFVAPENYFELPKVKRFRDWLEEQCRRFEAPQTR